MTDSESNRPEQPDATAQESDRPNEFGFAGAGTAPQPQRTQETGGVDGESIAVPAGDITGAVTDAIEETVESDRSES
jgi:hypothetical protein